MTLCDFKWLDISLQAHIICQKGVYLSERCLDSDVVILYRINDFYAEVYFNKENSELIKVISFHSEKLLEPYISRIDITGILSLFENIR